MSQYVDFDIAIGAPVNDAYLVQVSLANGFQDSDTLVLPTADPRYTNVLMKMDYSMPVTEDDILELGGLLYETLFKGKIWAAFVVAREDAARAGKLLRIKLSIEPDQVAVAAFPWEFACDDAGIPLATEHSFCRFLPRSKSFPALKVAPGVRLKLLLTSALPKEVAERFPLDIDAEVAAIRAELKPLEDAGKLEIIELRHVTGPALGRAIREEKPHILHYVGHGTFEGVTGALVLEKPDGSRQDYSARQLAIALNNSSVRLVILNACKTGTVVTNLLRGMAPALMAVNVPAVVGMQSSVQDEAGRTFAEEFYRALAAGEPIDGCVAAGRKSVIDCGISNLDWGLATLYMRAPDGMLFDGLAASQSQQTATKDAAASAVAPSQGNVSNTSVNLGSGNNFTGGHIVIGATAGRDISQGNTTTYGGSSPVGSPVPSTGEPNRREHLQTLRATLKERLYDLELQEAKFGKLYAPVYLTGQLRETRAELAQVEAELQQLGG